MAEYIMSCIGVAGSVLSTVFILLIIKPVYEGMYEDVFLKIGANINIWGKRIFIANIFQ
jgi:hypothetical protein